MDEDEDDDPPQDERDKKGDHNDEEEDDKPRLQDPPPAVNKEPEGGGSHDDAPPIEAPPIPSVTERGGRPKALLPTPTTKELANLVVCTPSFSTASLGSLPASWTRFSDANVPVSQSLPLVKGGGGVVGVASSPRKGKKDDGWKEVAKRYTM